MLNSMLHFTACGLVYDTLGVALLGFAFFFKNKKVLRLEGGTYWDANPHLLRSLIASRFDGIAGTLLLMLGFMFQLSGFLDYTSERAALVAYGLLVVIVVAYFTILRPSKIEQWHKDIMDMVLEPELEKGEDKGV